MKKRTNQEYVASLTNQEFIAVMDSITREIISEEGGTRCVCYECGRPLQEHRWISEQEMWHRANNGACSIMNAAGKFISSSVQKVPKTVNGSEKCIYLVTFLAKPEDPCDEDFMDDISS